MKTTRSLLLVTALAFVSPSTLWLAVPSSRAAVQPAPALEEENGYVKLGFDRLSGYKFVIPEPDPAAPAGAPQPTGEEQIPGWLRELSGRNALVTGYMIPVKMEGSLVTEFLLVSDPMVCCYGAVPDMNQWVIVRMKNGGVKPVQDVPISFYGKLTVGAMFENGYMTGIYALEGERMGQVHG